MDLSTVQSLEVNGTIEVWSQKVGREKNLTMAGRKYLKLVVEKLDEEWKTRVDGIGRLRDKRKVGNAADAELQIL